MMLSRRIFNGAIVAAALVTAVQLASAGASTAVPFSADAFKAAQASGKPAVIQLKIDPDASTPMATLTKIAAAAREREKQKS